MYSFPPFYFIRSPTLYNLPDWHVLFLLLLLMLFRAFYIFFFILSTRINSLFLTGTLITLICTWTSYLKRFSLVQNSSMSCGCILQLYRLWLRQESSNFKKVKIIIYLKKARIPLLLFYVFNNKSYSAFTTWFNASITNCTGKLLHMIFNKSMQCTAIVLIYDKRSSTSMIFDML